jgi:hypothetical protein
MPVRRPSTSSGSSLPSSLRSYAETRRRDKALREGQLKATDEAAIAVKSAAAGRPALANRVQAIKHDIAFMARSAGDSMPADMRSRDETNVRNAALSATASHILCVSRVK